MPGLETPSHNEINDPNGWHGDARAWQELGNPSYIDQTTETPWDSNHQYSGLTYEEFKAGVPFPESQRPKSWLDELQDKPMAATPETSTLPESFREVEEIKEIGKAALRNTVIFNPGGEDELRKEASVENTPEINRDAKEKFVVPRGWTTLIHGTDNVRWQLGEAVKTVSRMGLSAITAENAAKDRADAARLGNLGAFNTTENYARKGGSGAEPVEVRVFFYREDLSKQRVPAADVADIKAGLSPETLSLITKYHQPRHAVIPRDEQLIRLGQESDDATGRHVEYFVPRSVAADYLEAMARESVA